MSDIFESLKQNVLNGNALSADDAEIAFDALLGGALDPVDIAGFLIALKMRGETTDELLGAVRALRKGCAPDIAPDGAIDTCGTGGDGQNTLNISTTAALVLAAEGVPVAKHGNRSISSRSGSSDILSELGIEHCADKATAQKSLKQLNIAFLFAPHFHAAMANVAPVRQTLRTRTVFNLIGPMANPAAVKRQLIGVFDSKWCLPMAKTLLALGSEKAWVVHGDDGLDELSISGPSQVAALNEGQTDVFAITPEDAGLVRHPLSAIKGGSPADNAAALRAMLSGALPAYRDAVALNAGAGFVIAGKVSSLKDGAKLALDAIASGRVLGLVNDWATFSKTKAST